MITTQPNPCWILQHPNGDIYDRGGDGEPHFDTEADAAERRRDLIDTNPDYAAYLPALCAQPCVLVSCNECGTDLDSDEWAAIHFPDATLAAEMAREADFVVDGLDAWCDNCRDVPHSIVPDPASPETCLRCKTWRDVEHLEAVAG